MAAECNDDVYLVGAEFTDANGIPWFRDARRSLGRECSPCINRRCATAVLGGRLQTQTRTMFATGLGIARV